MPARVSCLQQPMRVAVFGPSILPSKGLPYGKNAMELKIMTGF
jgi:hypothetical protein